MSAIHPNLPPSSWPTDAPVLSLVDCNFNTWDCHLETVLGCYGSLADHLVPSYTNPDPALFPTSANNWRMNDQVLKWPTFGGNLSPLGPRPYQAGSD